MIRRILAGTKQKDPEINPESLSAVTVEPISLGSSASTLSRDF